MKMRMGCRAARLVALGVFAALLLAALGAGSASAASARMVVASSAPTLGGCPIFPADNVWNTDVSTLPVASNSNAIIGGIGAGGHLHPDFGAGLYEGAPIGIPYVVVPSSQAGAPVSFDYADESDPGPYPIPANAPIEGGAQSDGDRHVLVVQSGTCKLYETFASYPQENGSWEAGSGATWNLNSNVLRPSGWTSADAAGLPVLPGLVRYDEVAAGAINHAIRFTVSQTRNTYVWPGRHKASSATSANLPPMGLRLRLKAGVNIAGFSAANQVILTALKRYGMIVADNGSSWFLSGAPDDRWNNDDLHSLGGIPGSDFEVVDTSSIEVSANSGQARMGAVVGPVATATATTPAIQRVTPTPAKGTPTPTSDAATPSQVPIGSRLLHPSVMDSIGSVALVLFTLLCLGAVGLAVWRYARRR